MEEILPAYHKNGKSIRSKCKEIVCLYGKHYETGGLADRLRGLVAAYEISLKNGIGFKVWWNHPFLLTRFLEHNEVDWEITDDVVCWSLPETHVISAEITEEVMWQEKRICKLIEQDIHDVPCRQLHLYTNMRLAYEDGNFVKLFNKLFKPSKELNEAIDRELQLIGSDFIAVQCRFTGLLGDFKDVLTNELPSSQQESLVNNIITKIEEIHSKQTEEIPLLICTDSITFRDRILSALPYAYAIAGDIKHIDYATDKDSDAFLKVFLDLFMMTKAKQIYRVASKEMRLSGLPYMASLLGNKGLTDIII